MSELDGGPAFPLYIPEKSERFPTGGYTRAEQMIGGMTLRDYFAAKALPAIIAGSDATHPVLLPDLFSAIAEQAYQIADYMLKERAK